MNHKDTVQTMKKLLQDVLKDLDKGLTGNKAASQRARVNTVKLEKLAKIYRKESLPKRNKRLDEKKKSGQKR